MSERRIIRGAVVLALDGRRTPRKTDILLEDGMIAATGGVDTAAALVTDARGVVLPGLVQAQVHLSDALLDGAFAPDVDPRTYHQVQLETYRSCLDDTGAQVAVRAGFARGLSGGVAAFGEAGAFRRSLVIDAAREFGARVVVCANAAKTSFERDTEALMQQSEAGGYISTGVCVPDASSVSRSQLSKAVRVASDGNLPILAGATVVGAPMKGVARLASAGALGPHTSVTHLWNVDDKCARVLAESKTTAVLTPGLDLLFGAPPPNIELLLEAGVRIALSSVSNVTRLGFDLFAEARLAMRFLEGRTDQPASAILEMIAPTPARALNLPGGSVEVGKPADLIFLDLDASPGEPHEVIAKRVVDGAGPASIRNLWVGGKVVTADGRPRLSDPPEEDEETAIRAAARERVREEENRPRMRNAVDFATRALWRSRGWRI